MASSVGHRVRIHVQGELSPAWWSDVFADLVVATEPDGTSVLSGEVSDQAALHGLLTTIRDLGLSLISVETASTSPATSGSGG